MAQSKYRPLAETPFLEAPYDINSHPDSMREYLRINDVENERTFVVDMTFMLSRYGCMFGQCCSNRPHQVDGDKYSSGCCTESVLLSRENRWSPEEDNDDVARIERLLPEMDESIFANKRDADRNGVMKTSASGETRMRVKNGRCIFANPTPKKPGDPPSGCAFHHLANRKGVSHVETKPEVCWEVPLWAEYVAREDGRDEIVITGMSRSDWGGDDNYPDISEAVENEDYAALDGDYISWWCVDVPDAYSENNPCLYRSEENELRRIMGDTAYDQLCAIAKTYERRTKMPGEVVNAGKPTIATADSLFSRVRSATK